MAGHQSTIPEEPSMDAADNPILNNAWQDIGPTPASPSSPAPTKMSEPKVSAETKRVIGELSLKYPVSGAVSPAEHASQLALLCRDLIDIPPHILRQAAEKWAKESRWMPKASELRDMARSLATQPQADGSEGEKWKRRVREGNRMLIDGKMNDRAHWALGSGGIGCTLATGRMDPEAFDEAMTVDVAVFAHLKRGNIRQPRGAN
jgi:hypothetical protein